MQIDPQKVQKKLEELNKDGKFWEVFAGEYALTQVGLSDCDKVTFYPSKGILVKVFINFQTGELKIFPVFIFQVNTK